MNAQIAAVDPVEPRLLVRGPLGTALITCCIAAQSPGHVRWLVEGPGYTASLERTKGAARTLAIALVGGAA